MLVLRRKIGEKVVVSSSAGSSIITVLAVERGRVKLGIDAPSDVSVAREELLSVQHEEDASTPAVKYPNSLKQ